MSVLVDDDSRVHALERRSGAADGDGTSRDLECVRRHLDA